MEGLQGPKGQKGEHGPEGPEGPKGNRVSRPSYMVLRQNPIERLISLTCIDMAKISQRQAQTFQRRLVFCNMYEYSLTILILSLKT